jgi:preprotein translocase subunit SecD
MALRRSVFLVNLSLVLILTSCGNNESPTETSADVIQFRQVLSVGTSLSDFEFNGKTYKNIDCLDSRIKNEPAEAIVACAKDGDTVYLLGPTFLDGNSIKSAEAELTSDGYWIIFISFDDYGKKIFGEVTSRVTSLIAPQNQIALALESVVVSAPSINEEITGGEAQITGNFTAQEAKALATAIKNRESLPDIFRRRK